MDKQQAAREAFEREHHVIDDHPFKSVFERDGNGEYKDSCISSSWISFKQGYQAAQDALMLVLVEARDGFSAIEKITWRERTSDVNIANTYQRWLTECRVKASEALARLNTIIGEK